MQSDVEAKIRQTGVNVVPHQTTSPLPGMPLVYVNVKVAKIDEKYAYNVDIMCMTTPQTIITNQI